MKEKDWVIASLRDMEWSYQAQLESKQNDLDTSRSELLNKSFEVETASAQLSEWKAAMEGNLKAVGTMKTREELLMDEIALLQEVNVKADAAWADLKKWNLKLLDECMVLDERARKAEEEVSRLTEEVETTESRYAGAQQQVARDIEVKAATEQRKWIDKIRWDFDARIRAMEKEQAEMLSTVEAQMSQDSD